MAKNQNLPARLQEKDSQGEHDLIMYEHHEKTIVWCPRPNLSNPRSTNDIVWSLFTCEPNTVQVRYKIVSLQLAPSVGRACVLAQAVGRESSFVISNNQLQSSSVKFRQGLRFLTRGYAWQRPSHGWFQGLGRGANSSKAKAPYQKTRFWTEPRHCMVLGLKSMGKPTTWMRKLSFGQNQGIVWSQDSSLQGNQLLG